MSIWDSFRQSQSFIGAQTAPIGDHFFFLSTLLPREEARRDIGWYAIHMESNGRAKYYCRICGGIIGESEWMIDPKIVLDHEAKHLDRIEQELGKGTVGVIETIQKIGGVSFASACQDVWGRTARSRLYKLSKLV